MCPDPATFQCLLPIPLRGSRVPSSCLESENPVRLKTSSLGTPPATVLSPLNSLSGKSRVGQSGGYYVERGPESKPRSPRERLLHSLDPEVVAHRKTHNERSLNGGAQVAPTKKGPQYFRTFTVVRQELQAFAAEYPELVTLSDIGDSGDKVRGKYEHHDLLALRLGSKRKMNLKTPRALFMGGAHAREIANPELLLQWIKYLLQNYGKVPEVTALLDSRVLDFIPLYNPDGHRAVEDGYAGEPGGNLFQRKNTTPPDGVDLNRNWPEGWGGGASSGRSRSETYRGPRASSEYENSINSCFSPEAKQKR